MLAIASNCSLKEFFRWKRLLLEFINYLPIPLKFFFRSERVLLLRIREARECLFSSWLCDKFTSPYLLHLFFIIPPPINSSDFFSSFYFLMLSRLFYRDLFSLEIKSLEDCILRTFLVLGKVWYSPTFSLSMVLWCPFS